MEMVVARVHSTIWLPLKGLKMLSFCKLGMVSLDRAQS